MRMLDPKMYLHGNSKAMFTWTQVLSDEDSPVSYVGYVNQDDVLIVKSTIVGDVTTTLFACFRGDADNIDDIWLYRSNQTYTRFDLTRDGTPIFASFYQPFENADGSGAIGGTTEDPTSRTGVQIDPVLTVAKGTNPGGASFTANNRTVSTLTTAVSNGAKVQICLNKLIAGASGAMVAVVVQDSSPAVICSIRMSLVGTNYSFTILDKLSAVKATIYVNALEISPASGMISLDINLASKLVDVYSDDWTLSNNTDIDIGAGGAMASTDIKIIQAYFRAAVAESTEDMQICSLTVLSL